MASEVDIANRALQKMGEKSIVSMTENSVAAREVNRAFAALRDAELQAHPWVFAKARVVLSPDPTAPAFGLGYAYQLPSDYLRYIKQYDEYAYEIEGRMLLTDQGTSWNLLYVKRVTDVNLMDPLFHEVLASRIAFDLMEKFTQSKNKKEAAGQMYSLALANAKNANAIIRQPKDFPTTSWVSVRN